MSGVLVGKLRRRAEVFLKEAKRLLEGEEYDIACFNAEQALQLYLKSVILRVFGEMPRIHGVRELLGYLARRLYEEEEYKGYAAILKEFTRENRYSLSVLEDAYIDARYTTRGFSKREVKDSLTTVYKLIELLRRIENEIWMG